MGIRFTWHGRVAELARAAVAAAAAATVVPQDTEAEDFPVESKLSVQRPAKLHMAGIVLWDIERQQTRRYERDVRGTRLEFVGIRLIDKL